MPWVTKFLDSLDKIKANVPKVYAAGRAAAAADAEERYEQGKAEGLEQGKQAEYGKFWDTFQMNGQRTAYGHAFSRGNFSVETFYPKYDLIFVESNDQVFNNFSGQRVYADEPTWSLKQRLEECGVVLDTSKATTLSRLFDYCYHITEYPTIDLSSLTTLTIQRMFGDNSRVVTIEKIIVKDTIAPTDAFRNCSKLKNIVIEGTIGQNGFNFQWSTELSKESITSIVNALSTTASGKTITLSKTAVNNAFGSTTSEEWLALVNAHTNWTISTV